MSICKHCREVDCVWEDIGNEVKDYMQSKLNEGVVGSNVLRKHGYQKSISLIHGLLGKGNRVQLPHCVITGIRKEYPDEKGAYQGYREE